MHELTVEVLERDNISCSSPSPYLLHCLSLVYIIAQQQHSWLLVAKHMTECFIFSINNFDRDYF